MEKDYHSISGDSSHTKSKIWNESSRQVIDKIIIYLMILILINIVNADVDVSIDVESDGGDITIEANPNSGEGDTTYLLGDRIIDGKSLGNELNTMNDDILEAGHSGFSGISEILRGIGDLFMRARNGVWKIVNPSDLDSNTEIKTRYIFDNYFVPRMELINIINYQQKQIASLQLEILAIHEILQPTYNETYMDDIICDAKLKVGKKLNISSVNCDGIIHYNHIPGDEYVSIESIN